MTIQLSMGEEDHEFVTLDVAERSLECDVCVADLDIFDAFIEGRLSSGDEDHVEITGFYPLERGECFSFQGYVGAQGFDFSLFEDLEVAIDTLCKIKFAGNSGHDAKASERMGDELDSSVFLRDFLGEQRLYIIDKIAHVQ